MLGGESGDDRASARLARKFEQRGRDGADEAAVSVPSHEAELGRHAQRGVGAASVFERPPHQLLDEALGEAGEPRPFGVGKDEHDRGTMLEAVVE